MKTLFDKIWDAHVVTTVKDGPTASCTSTVTSVTRWLGPPGFLGPSGKGGWRFATGTYHAHGRPQYSHHGARTSLFATIPPVFRVETLEKNARDFGLTYYRGW